jgi:hypothetical protein
MHTNNLSTPLPGHCIAGISGRSGDRVYYLRGNRQFVRSHVMPANPRTERQQQGRVRFAGLVARWRLLGPAHRERWNHRAKRLNMSGYNLFISMNMKKREVRRVKRPFRSPAESQTRRENDQESRSSGQLSFIRTNRRTNIPANDLLFQPYQQFRDDRKYRTG